MFEIINETKENIDELNILKDYVKHLVEKLKLNKCEFNLIIVNDKKIHEINKEYRNVDRATDVISFAMEDNMDITYKDFRLLGDIYISIDRCYEQALEYGHSKTREICFLATHGILHLLGYDHMEETEEKEMFKIQEELLESYNIKR